MEDVFSNTAYYEGLRYRNITHRPHFLQYIATDMSLIALNIAGWTAVIAYSSIISPWTVALMSFFTLYHFLHCQYITGMKYHIGLEQLMYQRGIFSVKRDYIEMYRIVDYEESRNFIEILFGLKTVTIHACDRTTPSLNIIGIPYDLEIIETIRERVELCKKKRGVYEITNR